MAKITKKKTYPSRYYIVFKKLKRRIRNVFITGLLITLPIALTYWILQLLFTNLDALPQFSQKSSLIWEHPFRKDIAFPLSG